MNKLDTTQPALITDRRHVPAVGGATLAAVLAVSALTLMVEGLHPLFKVAAAAAIVGQQVYDFWEAGRHVRARRLAAQPAAAARLQRYGAGDFQGVTTPAVLAGVALVGVVAKVVADGSLVVDPMSWGVPGVVLVLLATVDIVVSLVRDPVNSARAAMRQDPAPVEQAGPSVTVAPAPPAASRMVKAPKYGLILEPGEQVAGNEKSTEDAASATR
ncbi:hypothetical protein [Georgenia sp. SUBG003]|uniref:hypothetical protein n=1 Tax=Georgenia sp. SUBG003 TaxID=1497974 RepID=UPI0004DA96B6|nr:hypothetical protein DA06_00490 [Georgenia sp. SUBG003]